MTASMTIHCKKHGKDFKVEELSDVTVYAGPKADCPYCREPVPVFMIDSQDVNHLMKETKQ